MTENIYNFQKLTPSADIDLDIYKDALDYVFANEDIRNIAVSGSYGAGKSSMMETYKLKRKDLKFLHISLAHFEQDYLLVNNNSNSSVGDDDSESDTKSKIESVLEGKILNQLIHQIEPNKILQTKFRVKRTMSTDSITISVLHSMIFFILLSFIWFHDEWRMMVNSLSFEFLKMALYFTTTTETVMLSAIGCGILLKKFLYFFIKAQKTHNILKKISVQGNDIEIFEDADESYFDKYLNEVLYLFESADVDAIVFEDMDRYNTNVIFEKLREINTLLNQRKHFSDNSSNQKVMRFIYLLRDDIFISKDRTKFFDFIVPIVPVIDGSNSYDKFIEYFKQGDILSLFEPSFMQELSLYVDDMRILKNIYNEFIIYHTRFLKTSTEQDDNKLLAMITYKNIFPRDFARLQLSQGYVYTLFSNKDEFIKVAVNELNRKIKECQLENKEIENEICDTIYELDATFINLPQSLMVNDNNISSYGDSSEIIKIINENPNCAYIPNNNYAYNSTKFNLKGIYSELMKNPKYMYKKQLIEKKANKEIEINNRKIIQFNSDIEALKNYYLKQITSLENSNRIFQVSYKDEMGDIEDFADIKKSPYFALIKYLIRSGYIDETYPDYMTYFYENSISRTDKIFLRSITDREAKEYSFKLVNPALVISRIRIIDFKAVEALNYELLNFLVNNRMIYFNPLETFLEGLIERKPIEFMKGYLQFSKTNPLFVEEFNKSWNWACDWIINTEAFDYDIKKDYIVQSLHSSSDDVLEKNNITIENDDDEDFDEDINITKFIETDKYFLHVNTVEIATIIHGLLVLEVKFEAIKFDGINEELFQSVYKNDLYCINMDMINLILQNIYGFSKKELCLPLEAGTKHYTLISSKTEEPLFKYINENMETYLKMLYKLDLHICDDEKYVLEILNEVELPDAIRNEYLVRLLTKITDLDNVNDKELWTTLIASKKVAYNHFVIYSYFYSNEHGLNGTLVQYINDFNDSLELNTQFIDDTYGKEARKKLFIEIIKTNNINNNKYAEILRSLNLYLDEISFEGVSDDKITILISLDIIKMTKENLMFMREKYEEVLEDFILTNIDKYVNLMTTDLYSTEELMIILDSETSDENKIKLLSFENSQISIENKCYSEDVTEAVLKSNFNLSELSYILMWYPENMPKVRRVILDIAIARMNDIMSVQMKLDKALLQDLLLLKSLDVSKKARILAIMLYKLGLDEIKEYFKFLKLDKFSALMEGKRRKIESTSANEELLSALEEQHLIVRNPDKNNANYYWVDGRVPKKEDLGIELL